MDDTNLGNGEPNIVNEEVKIINPESSDNVKKSKKKFPKTFIILGIILAVLIAGGGVTYYALTSNSKTLYKTALNVKTGDLVDFLKELDDNLITVDVVNDSFLVEGDLKFNTNFDELENLEGYSYDYMLGIDLQNVNAYGSVGIKDNDDILRASASFDEDKILVESLEIMDYILSIDLEDAGVDFNANDIKDMINEFDFESINFDDSIYVIEKISEYIGESLDEDAFDVKDGTLRVNGDSLDVKRHIYTVDDKLLLEMYESILESIKDDDKFIEILEKSMMMSSYSLYNSNGTSEKIDVKDMIDDALDEIESVDASGEDLFEITIYTNGIFNTVVGMSIDTEVGEMLLYTEKDDKLYFSVMEDLFEIEAEVKKETTTFEVKSNFMEFDKFEGSYSYLEGEYTFDVIFEYEGIEIDVESSMTLNRKSDKELDTEFKISGNLVIPEFDNIEFDFTTNNNLSIGKLPEISGDIKDFNDLTDDEITDMNNKLEDILDKEPFKSFSDTLGFGALSNSIMSSTLCANTISCACNGDTCICSYLDENGDLQFGLECPDTGQNDSSVGKTATSYSNIFEIEYDDIFYSSAYGDEMILLISSTTCPYCTDMKESLNEAAISLDKEVWVIEVDKLDADDADWLEFDFPYSGTPTVYHVVYGDTDKSLTGARDTREIIDWLNK